MTKRIWLTWEHQRRNRSMSSLLNTELYELVVDGSRLRRYVSLIFKTIRIVLVEKPSIIFAQNPSLLLSAICVLVGKVTKIPIIIDAHNAGLFPVEGKSKTLNTIARIVNSHADKVIVSNSSLVKYVNKEKGDIIVFPDPIPNIIKHYDYSLAKDKFNLVFICSWADDEPYGEVLNLDSHIPDEIHIYVTGNSKGREQIYCDRVPNNITLTGFLDSKSYESLLACCDGIMVLTTREDCLVCGAYEAVSVEKPLILSKTDALIQYFDKGCVYTGNTRESIAMSLQELISRYEELKKEIIRLKEEKQHNARVILKETSAHFS